MRSLLFAAFLAFVPMRLAADSTAAPVIRIRKDSGRGLWGVEATNAPLGDVAKALSRSMGCTITVDEKAADLRLDTLITPRVPERLTPLLGRRARVSASLVYRFELPGVGETSLSSPPGFGKEVITQDLRESQDVEEALRTLRIPCEVGEGVKGKLRLRTLQMPVHRVLDQIATQSGSRWTVVIRLRARTAPDEAAAREEEPRFLYSDLAQLTSAERREEIQADLDHLMALPEEKRAEAVKSLAGNLSGMNVVFKQSVQENRDAVAGNVAAIVRDYDHVLRRLPSDHRAWAVPLNDALRELTLELRALQ